VNDHQYRLARVRDLIAAEPDPPLRPKERGGAGAHRSAGAGIFGGSPGSLQRLCRAAARAIPASGVGLSVMTDDGVHGVVAGSDATSVLVEELQFTTGEGPCIDAVTSGRPVLSADLDQMMTRWPGYAPAAHQQGVRAVFAFPLRIGALRMGAMDIYNDRPGPLPVSAVDQALAFAEVAMLTVLDGQDQAPAGEPAAVLQDGLIARAELYQAQGLLSAQLGVDLDEAMSQLRAHAYAHDRPLIDVARDVVERRLVLNSDRPDSDDGSLNQTLDGP
jgi:hypothetical protein